MVTNVGRQRIHPQAFFAGRGQHRTEFGHVGVRQLAEVHPDELPRDSGDAVKLVADTQGDRRPRGFGAAAADVTEHPHSPRVGAAGQG
jgi:hypothetical protein